MQAFVDVPTILLAGILSSVAVAGIIALIWRQNPELQALGWWSGAYASGAVGLAVILLGRGMPQPLQIACAATVIGFSYGLLFIGARVFNGRSPGVRWLLLLPLTWLVILQIPDMRASTAWLMSMSFGVIGSLSAAAAFELWRGRAERLPTRIAAVLLFAIHALVTALTTVGFAWPDFVAGSLVLASTAWLPFRVVEGYLFSIGLGVTLVALVKERAERLQHARSITDPLTGALNRRALFDEGEFFLRKSSERNDPVSVILFDLDNFKAVNDQLGHLEGDNLLVLFARSAAGEMRPGELFGRVGGDEFVALVAGTEHEACASAERVQARFRSLCSDGKVFCFDALTTVSAGIASRRDGESLSSLLGRADRALYLAKHNGRDRVESMIS